MRKQDLFSIIQAPVISEKSAGLSEKEQQFVFRVKKDASKNQIKRAVEMAFEVQVDSVNVLNIKGKHKRFGRHFGQRSNWKKAYVKLKPGFNIDLSPA